MGNYFDAFKIDALPLADKKNTFVYGESRLTLITNSLLRVEIVKNGEFCDEPTQSVWYRNFAETQFKINEKGNKVIIKTPCAEFCYNKSSHKLEYINLSDSRHVTNYKAGNLKGTRRTLDRTFGSVPIGDGIISKNGVAVLNDDKSLAIKDDGTIKPRKSVGTDRYYFAYGYNYTEAVADLFRLTGKAPLVPRFAFGNWWSRYKAYTQEEYITLMQRFIDEEIPITVATVDMDWHWVDVKKQFGSDIEKSDADSLMGKIYQAIFKGGWTGYSWNTDLFPDYKEFLNWLHKHNFKVPLNLHPADGVRFFEDMYDDFAKFMGDDPKDKKTYSFDITDKKFVEGYFDILHKPYQDQGVDFWWIDWQQGNKTKVPGLDPLWALNHYHSMDLARDGKRRPLILSRFANAGSQRYPLGFSGDTAQNWEVLDFQPYFTSTASNIGYTWWSHDIGGHHFGYKDDELYIRWVQFGIFSPINRLHSTSNEFMGKEPWKYSQPIGKLCVDALRLRHRMLPYLYTMNYRTANDCVALCEPMYYHNPKDENAYKCRNEYYFGSELIVAPITTPKDSKTNLAGVEVWLPQGRYTDIFNGRIYDGGRTIKMFRDESSIPVLAKEGAIIPLSMNDRDNDCTNPENMEILIYRGNGEFSMYEDDGETMNYKNGAFAFTDFAVSEKESTLEFTIDAVRGDAAVIPSVRNYRLSFKDVSSADISLKVNGEEFDFAEVEKDGCLFVDLMGIKPTDSVVVSLVGFTARQNLSKRELLIELISKFQGKNNSKAKKYTAFVDGKAKMPVLPVRLSEPINEIENMFD